MAAGKIASALAKGAETESEEDTEDDAAPGDLEIKAMKAFERAATPEAKAMAMKAFVKACMAGGY